MAAWLIQARLRDLKICLPSASFVNAPGVCWIQKRPPASRELDGGFVNVEPKILNPTLRSRFMTISTFALPRTIIYGENALDHLGTLTGKRAALVTGGSSMKRLGFLDRARELLEQAGFECIIIDHVEPNPSVTTVRKGAQAMQAFQPDWIVAIGGGSAIDAAKVMWCFYEHPQLDFQDIIPVGSMPPLRNKARFIAIPSTSGSGSEITAFSVITDTENHIKYPIVAADMVPDIAILDPRLPATMPAHITAHTGMDVLTHALEAYVSTAATSFTDPYALEAVRLVFEHLETAYLQPDNLAARYHM